MIGLVGFEPTKIIVNNLTPLQKLIFWSHPLDNS